MFEDMQLVRQALYQCTSAELSRAHESRVTAELKEAQRLRVYAAAVASYRATEKALMLAKTFGREDVLINGERRFEARRLGGTTYLLGERKDENLDS